MSTKQNKLTGQLIQAQAKLSGLNQRINAGDKSAQVAKVETEAIIRKLSIRIENQKAIDEVDAELLALTLPKLEERKSKALQAVAVAQERLERITARIAEVQAL